MHDICNNYSCNTVIEVHEMHGRVHLNWGLATILLAHDPPFIVGLPCPMIDHP